MNKIKNIAMNKRQKLQVGLAVLFTVLFVIWLFIPVPMYSRILGLLSNGLGVLSMVLSYKAEEKNKKKSD
jgi:Zn-dependent protease